MRPRPPRALTCHDHLLRGQLAHKQLSPLQQGSEEAAASADRVLDLLLVLRLREEGGCRVPHRELWTYPSLHRDSSPIAAYPCPQRDPRTLPLSNLHRTL